MAGLALLGAVSPASAELFYLDEFFVVKNGTEIFRDSFNDGQVPPSGPDDGLTSSGNTYGVIGPSAMIAEVDGRLVIDPYLGITPQFGSGDFRTEARTILGTNPASDRSLGLGDAIEVHGLYALSGLPSRPGNRFGTRLTDSVQGVSGNNIASLTLTIGSATGTPIVVYAEADAVAETLITLSTFSLESLLGANPNAALIDLTLYKEADADLVTAGLTLLDSDMVPLAEQMLAGAVQVFLGEAYIRPAFVASARIPEPAPVAILMSGLMALVLVRRQRF